MGCYANLVLVGYVGQDPVIPNQNNPDFVKFSLAVTETWKDKSGEKKENTEWYNVFTSSEKKANLVKNYVKKGMQLFIEGVPKKNEYQDKNGTTRCTIDVNLGKITFLGKASDNMNSATYDAPKAEQIRGSSYVSAIPLNDFDDDIPF